MSSENSGTTNNTWQPDPAWDYYTLWHDLIHIKAKIDQALNRMKNVKEFDREVHEDLSDILQPASSSLIQIIDIELTQEFDDDDDE
ncbi:hypothetical protein ACX27_01740 [Nostoc piscinale CENA21]|uniref:Uncharacterized protein n=1 Tax=Nostoc piscinale CENA21 TaxID=224013 RepID=A0A0M4T108_9NOSO|nr:hypothetical protein [Nostoc piscinale]ALF51854.1 hypothetical protein ACX27_01740 [Nostoc piscinale CENA21]